MTQNPDRTSFVQRAICSLGAQGLSYAAAIAHARKYADQHRRYAEAEAGVLRAGESGGRSSRDLYNAERRMRAALLHACRCRAVVIFLQDHKPITIH